MMPQRAWRRSRSGLLVSGGGGIPSDFVSRHLFNGDFTDETGNYNGTNAGATFLSAGDGPGGTDYGINVGGASKFVTLPTSLLTAVGAGANTISCWIRCTNITEIALILSAADTATGSLFYVAELGNGTDLYPRTLFSDAPSSVRIIRGTTAQTASTWVPVIFRTDDTTISIRANKVNLGISVDGGSNDGDSIGEVPSVDNVLIGRLQRNILTTGATFDLGPMTTYSRKLSDAECEQLESEW